MRHSRQVLLPHAVLSLAVLAVTATANLTAQDGVGVLVDRGSAALLRVPMVHVFDPDSMQITTSIPLPLAPFAQVFDVEIAADLGTAYVSDFLGHAIWVIDLTLDPPALAGGINPIVVTSNSVQDLELTPDGSFLLAATGNELASAGGTGSSLSVVDVATRTQVHSVNFAPNCPIAVAAGPDGSVVVSELLVSQTAFANTNVRRFTIDANGALADTAEVAGIGTVPGVQNLLIPSYPHLPRKANTILSQHTVHVSRPAGATFGSLRTEGLTVAQGLPLGNPTGIDLCFDPLRHILYVRSNELGVNGGAGVGNGRIDGYLFLPFLGSFGPQVMSVALERRAGTAFGVEQTAVDPVSRRLFVSGLANGEVRVFNSITGDQEGTITHPDFLWGVGINVKRR